MLGEVSFILMNQMKESINIMNYIFRSTSSSFQKKKRKKHDDPRHKIEEVENSLQSSLITNDSNVKS